jgi:two-component system response regulator (stage 0 sporulation protein A)
LTALIITDNQESFRYYDRALRQENIYAKHSFFNPHEVFNKLLAVQPDILLMEVGLGDRAAWLLDYLSQLHLPRRPAIFICMGQRTSSWEQLFLRKGAMYVFDKSMSEMNIADCMLNLHSLYRNLEREENLYPELVRLLRDCGFSPKHRGYDCIVECVQMLFREENSHKALTKKVYPHVAKTQSTTPMNVEKNIRDAIRYAWSKGDGKTLQLHLGFDDHKRPPSNGKLLSSLCQQLREILHEKQHSTSDTSS